MAQPNFSTSRDEFTVISAIADRAIATARRHGDRLDKMSTVMDLSAAHNACPLRLVALLDADDFTFAHDVFGIINHLDRRSGEIGGHFRPRLAAPTA